MEFCAGLPAPARAAYEAGPTGFWLARADGGRDRVRGGGPGQDRAPSAGSGQDRSPGRGAARASADDRWAGRVAYQARDLAPIYERLRAYPSVGPFLAFRFAIDLSYSELIDAGEDEFVVARLLSSRSGLLWTEPAEPAVSSPSRPGRAYARLARPDTATRLAQPTPGTNPVRIARS
jgi:hypothetical protein